jgi:hypothetical protein
VPAVGVVESDAALSLEAATAETGRGGGGESGSPGAAARSGAAARRAGAGHPTAVGGSLALDSAEHFRPGRVRDVYAGIDQIVRELIEHRIARRW